MKKTKLIIFDLDGVLFDTIPNATKNFLRNHSGVTEAQYKEIHTGNYHVNSEKYKSLQISKTDLEIKEKRTNYLKSKSKSPLFANIKEMLEKLFKAGYIIALNTSSYNEASIPLLVKGGVKNLFDFLGTAEVSKDKVEKFALLQEKYEVTYDEMIFVTDALGDVRDSGEMNIPTIAVTWGVHDRSFFTREDQPHLIGIVDTVDELINCIESEN